MPGGLYNLLHGLLPGSGFLGRSASGAGPAALLSGADAVALLPAATASADGKATAAQIALLTKMPIVTKQQVTPSQPVDLSTSYASVADVTYTPYYTTGKVSVDWKVYIASVAAAEDFIAHLKIIYNGETKHTWSESKRGDNNSEGYIVASIVVDNYTGSRTFSLQAREYNASHEAKFHQTYTKDGITYSEMVPYFITITETP